MNIKRTLLTPKEKQLKIRIARSWFFKTLLVVGWICLVCLYSGVPFLNRFYFVWGLAQHHFFSISPQPFRISFLYFTYVKIEKEKRNSIYKTQMCFNSIQMSKLC